MAAQEDTITIPQPPPSMIFGNLRDIDPANMPASLWHLADVYGEIFRLELAGRKTVVCSSYETVSDLCDWSRFEKPVQGPLEEVRALTGDGLFTAYPGEKNWGVAHRILMPVFGPMGIRKMWGGMMDIASQMLLSWDRFGPDNEILCSDEFTKLAFDMIGLCAFGFRFNNFYAEKPHAFVTQMADVLRECGKRASRLSIENKLRIFSAAQTEANIKAMLAVCDQIIEDRVKHPQPDSNDLLNPMLENTDPETGEKMSRANVRNNMVTFLVAGHETTSGTLGFTFYHLLKNPNAYLKVQQEVDEVLGKGPIEGKHLSQLVYVKYAIYEALRFMGPISMNAKHALKPHTKIAGKYVVEPEEQIFMNLKPFMHDRKVWGEDADMYRPERFLNGGYEKLPPNAFKAFGDGPRACIGRGFAEQEMIMTVALIMQNFNVEMADPSYELQPFVSLTIKPGNFKIKVRRRPGSNLTAALGGASTETRSAEAKKATSNNVTNEQNTKPMTILYGSNAGTCKSYAEELESNAHRFGFKATVSTLDSATEHIPKDQPVVIIAPSYEGKPADNAQKFCQWLQTCAPSKQLKDVSYAVFGVGNSDWAQTFHRVPTLIDEIFEKNGGVRFTSTGFVDVKYDIMGPWEEWTEIMWKDLRQSSGTMTEIFGGELKAEITPPKFAAHLGGADVACGVVKVNRDIGGAGVGLPKKHIEVELPPGMAYRSGDYIVVLPINDLETTKRILRRFSISADDSITVTGTNKAFLSPDVPTSVFDLLMTRVELGTPVSQKQIKALIDLTPETKREKLQNLTTDDVYKKEVLGKRFTILDLLEDSPDTQLPFEKYLDMLKPLTTRQYSISSSPLANVDFVQSSNGTTEQKFTASLTYDVHDEPSLSGHGQFHGVASTYLARQAPGDRIRCHTRATNVNFHLPLDPMTPIIMVCAGSGLAPMRGFMQERATIKAARNMQLGPAILYFGCRDYEKDFIYYDELHQWEKEGVVSVRPCFSKRGPEDAKVPKYVPDRMWEDRDELADLFRDGGAKIFVCGSAAKLGKSTAEVCKKIYMDKSGTGEAEAQEWLDKAKEDRYVSDTFE